MKGLVQLMFPGYIVNYCIDHYILTINNGSDNTYNISTNLTSVSVAVTIGQSYSFSVRAIDSGGRESNESDTVSLELEGECFNYN